MLRSSKVVIRGLGIKNHSENKMEAIYCTRAPRVRKMGAAPPKFTKSTNHSGPSASNVALCSWMAKIWLYRKVFKQEGAAFFITC